MAKRWVASRSRAIVHDYEIVNADTADFFALVKSATLTEISLTDTPSNPEALVHDRNRYPPALIMHELLIAKMQCLQKLTNLLKGFNHVHQR